jgi:hypothetical protein
MYDLAFSPPASTADTEIQLKFVKFQGNIRKIKKRANEDYAATERDANKKWRADEDYLATERDVNRAWRGNQKKIDFLKTQPKCGFGDSMLQ